MQKLSLFILLFIFTISMYGQDYYLQCGKVIDTKNGVILSEKTNVVSGFRDKDILNGGQGAPLAPLYHYVISSKIKVKFPTVVINIGGIANITYIKNKNNLFAFDTGPGNYLIDKLNKKVKGSLSVKNSRKDINNKTGSYIIKGNFFC